MSSSTAVYFTAVDSQISETFDSIWKSTKAEGRRTAECQTSSSLYEFDDGETQTAVNVSVETQFPESGTTKSKSRDSNRIMGDFDGHQNDDDGYDKSMITFLQRIYPEVIKELTENISSKAFDGYDITVADSNEDVAYWKTLSVDLERKKVVFPDWSTAKHFPGIIVKCTVTRNKERLYDIDYDDGQRLQGVREEHIRWISGSESSSAASRQTTTLGPAGSKGARGGTSTTNANAGTKKGAALASRLQEGVRVHAKVIIKGREIYVPGRVIKVQRGGSYDVDVEGGKTEYGVSVDDLMMGLEEGGIVEARRPNKVHLQGTSVSWNATGSTLAVAYGRSDIVGWCDYPGAVCLWNVFGKSFDPLNPDVVLDHSSCIMCVKCHPQQPAMIAGGSFNGEVVVWDMTLPEQLLAVSLISEYGHKEPILSLEWLYDPPQGEWVLCSVSADGRVLFWSVASANNGCLKYPVRGVLLSSASSSKRSGKQKGLKHGCHGGVSLSFASGSASGMGGVSATSSLPKWFVVGQQGGSIVRGQSLKALGTGSRLGPDSFRNAPAAEDLYPPIRRGEDVFAHESHIGSVNACSCSPFNRNLFLTAGSDGIVKMFHMFEQTPIRQWEPAPPPGTPGVSGTFAAINCVEFSPIRPLLFAAGSAEGFVYLFDLSSPSSVPVLVLEAKPSAIGLAKPSDNGADAGGSSAKGDDNKTSTGGAMAMSAATAAKGRAEATFHYRSGITSIAFNRKQRDLLCACDYLGRVHVWRLSWGLSHKGQNEQTDLDRMGSGSNNTTVSASAVATTNDPAAAAAGIAAAAAGKIARSSSNHGNNYKNPHNSTRSDGSEEKHHGKGSDYVQDPAEFLSRIAEAESEKAKARRAEPSWDS